MNDLSAHNASTLILIAQAHSAEEAPHTANTHATTAAEPHAGESHGAEGGHHEATPWGLFLYSMLAFVVISIMAILATRRMLLVPRGLQNVFEMIIDSLYSIPKMVMGDRGLQYAPFLATFFVYIAVMNLMGLIPFFKPGTASLSTTIGLALVAFFAVQYFGFKAHGIRYLMHFFGPIPITGVASLIMGLILLPLELLAEMIRPLSLSFRLYGNIYGEEQVVTQLAMMQVWVPVLMLPLQVMTSILQAFVFTLLVTVYISLATAGHDEHEEGTPEHAH